MTRAWLLTDAAEPHPAENRRVQWLKDVFIESTFNDISVSSLFNSSNICQLRSRD